MREPRPSGPRNLRHMVLFVVLVVAGVGLWMLLRPGRERPALSVTSAQPMQGEARAPPVAPRASHEAQAQAPAANAGAASDEEARLIARMRVALDKNPEEVLAIDRTASTQFQNSPRSTERGLLRIRALVRLDRIGEARSAAEALIERYPDDPNAQSAAAFMGLHPRPPWPAPR
jgi:hypothetical protein